MRKGEARVVSAIVYVGFKRRKRKTDKSVYNGISWIRKLELDTDTELGSAPFFRAELGVGGGL